MEQNGKEYEKAIQYIYSLIDHGEVEIGSKLPSERKISEMLSISRNSIREALRMLENMGIIESRQGLGNYLSGNVTQNFANTIHMMLVLKQTDADDISQFRRNIERAIYDLAYKNRHESPYLAQMASIFTKIPQADLNQRIELDKEFHYLLIRMADNTMFSVIMDSLSTVYHQWIEIVWHHASEEVMQHLYEAHCGIYESLIHNDIHKGIEAIEYHYDIIDALSFHQWEKKDSCTDFHSRMSKDSDVSGERKVF